MTAAGEARGPRYVFVTDRATDDDATRFGWRLDAANHRPLGRGVGTHSSLESCHRLLDVLRDESAGIVNVLSFDSVRGLWTWRVTRDSRALAVSVRTYARRFDCRRAAAHFLGAIVDSDPREGVLRVVRSVVLDRYAADLGAADVRPAGTPVAR